MVASLLRRLSALLYNWDIGLTQVSVHSAFGPCMPRTLASELVQMLALRTQCRPGCSPGVGRGQAGTPYTLVQRPHVCAGTRCGGMSAAQAPPVPARTSLAARSLVCGGTACRAYGALRRLSNRTCLTSPQKS